MSERMTLKYPILVEGKYDKITLSALIDSRIIPLGGYAVFRSEDMRALLRRLAEVTPLLVLTDSDGGGRQIRSYLSSILPKERLIGLYIPKLEGKERRKRTPGKAGLLGVEGMPPDILRGILAPYACGAEEDVAPASAPITKLDLYRAGLSGGEDSAARRAAFAESLGLPPDMTANALLEAANLLITREEFSARFSL